MLNILAEIARLMVFTESGMVKVRWAKSTAVEVSAQHFFSFPLIFSHTLTFSKFSAIFNLTFIYKSEPTEPMPSTFLIGLSLHTPIVAWISQALHTITIIETRETSHTATIQKYTRLNWIHDQNVVCCLFAFLSNTYTCLWALIEAIAQPTNKNGSSKYKSSLIQSLDSID